MKVFLAGSTGFVGRAVAGALVRRGHAVKALVRKGSEERAPRGAGIEAVQGDLLRPYTFELELAGCQAAVNCVGILREIQGKRITYDRIHVEAVKNLLGSLRAARVPRLVHVSAIGARADAPSAYHRSKFLGEEEVRRSGLYWTIVRPSMIFGTEGPGLRGLARLVRLPLVPVLGDGLQRVQPVAVADLASGIVACLERQDTAGRTIEAGGAERYPVGELLEEAALALAGRRPRKLRIPMGAVLPIVRLLEGLDRFPLSTDVLEMLREDSVCDEREFADLLPGEPLRFSAWLRGEAAAALTAPRRG